MRADVHDDDVPMMTRETRRFDSTREKTPVWPDSLHNVYGHILWIAFGAQVSTDRRW
jgi:hypothetical protein